MKKQNKPLSDKIIVQPTDFTSIKPICFAEDVKATNERVMERLKMDLFDTVESLRDRNLVEMIINKIFKEEYGEELL